MHYMCGFVGCLTERRSKILVQEVYFSFLIMMCFLSWCINTILFPCILSLHTRMQDVPRYSRATSVFAMCYEAKRSSTSPKAWPSFFFSATHKDIHICPRTPFCPGHALTPHLKGVTLKHLRRTVPVVLHFPKVWWYFALPSLIVYHYFVVAGWHVLNVSVYFWLKRIFLRRSGDIIPCR